MQSYSAKLCRGSRDPTNLLNFHRKRTPLYLSVANSLTPTLSVHISEEDDFVALQYLSHRVNINLTTGIQSLHSIYAKQASMSGYLSTLTTSLFLPAVSVTRSESGLLSSCVVTRDKLTSQPPPPPALPPGKAIQPSNLLLSFTTMKANPVSHSAN